MSSLSLTEAARISSAYTPSPEELAFHQRITRNFQSTEESLEVGKEGVQVGMQFLDRVISVMEMDVISADIWMEDDRDILMQALPASRGSVFPNFELARTQWNNINRRVFSGVPGVIAQGEYFGARIGDFNVSRKSDPKDRGRDMFQIRLVNLFTRPRAADAAAEALKMFNDVLAWRSVPVI